MRGWWGRWWRGAALTVAAVLPACTAARAPEPTREAVLQRILPSSVQVVIEQQDGGRRVRTGSGVAIAAAGQGNAGCFILTSGHTLSGPMADRDVYVVFGRDRGRYEKARASVLVHRDTPDLDLAVLRTQSPQCAPAVTGDAPVLGTPVWVIGFPWGKSMTLASGVVSQVIPPAPLDGEESARLMVDASVSYGISGGPVFDARSGQLLGIVEGYNTARVTPQGASGSWYIDVPVPGQTFVTPVTDIRRFLTEEGLGGLFNRVNGHARGASLGFYPRP